MNLIKVNVRIYVLGRAPERQFTPTENSDLLNTPWGLHCIHTDHTISLTFVYEIKSRRGHENTPLHPHLNAKMPSLDTRGIIAAAQIGFYFPVAAISLFLVIRYGFRRDAGWLFLFIFALGMFFIYLSKCIRVLMFANSPNGRWSLDCCC